MQYTLSTHPEFGHRTIRNICITDCTRDKDYHRIRHLCGDYDNEAEVLSAIERTDNSDNLIGDNMLLYDNGSTAFMYFWAPELPTPDTHHFMTVQEFYDLFDTTANAPYEYW